MPSTFSDDQANTPKDKRTYIAPVLVGFLGCVLVGQIILMVVPLTALNKVSGRITRLDTVIISYTHHKFSGSTPNYGLAITLNNSQSFKIQEIDGLSDLDGVLKKGDYVTIYYPPLLLKIVSATLARDVSQVERGGQVLYSWKGQQSRGWYFVVFLAVITGLFYWMMVYIRNFLKTKKLK